LKIRVFSGWSQFVSACVERDKKILDFWIFALTSLRIWSIFRSCFSHGLHGFFAAKRRKKHKHFLDHEAHEENLPERAYQKIKNQNVRCKATNQK